MQQSHGLFAIAKLLVYKSCNDVLIVTAKHIMNLLSLACRLPLIVCCTGAMDLTDVSVSDLAVCWNDCFPRIFGYKRVY